MDALQQFGAFRVWQSHLDDWAERLSDGPSESPAASPRHSGPLWHTNTALPGSIVGY